MAFAVCVTTGCRERPAVNTPGVNVATPATVDIRDREKANSGNTDNNQQAEVENPDNTDLQDPRWYAGIDILESLHKEKPVGKPVPEYWASTVEKMFNRNLSKEELNQLREKYRQPANVPYAKTPEVFPYNYMEQHAGFTTSGGQETTENPVQFFCGHRPAVAGCRVS